MRKNEQRFIKEVTRKMEKAGFKCIMKDGVFAVGNGDYFLQVNMCDIPGWGKRRVRFMLNFALKEMENVRKFGLLTLASESNNHSQFTTTQFFQDHFTCRIETFVSSAKDFVREFEFASKEIFDTYNTILDNYPRFQETFKEQPQRRPIGYLANTYEDIPSVKDDTCNKIAQIGYIFVGEKN